MSGCVVVVVVRELEEKLLIAVKEKENLEDLLQEGQAEVSDLPLYCLYSHSMIVYYTTVMVPNPCVHLLFSGEISVCVNIDCM